MTDAPTASATLAIDTSIGSVVAVVASDGRTVAEVASDDHRRHAEAIGPLIADALVAARGAGVTIDRVVAGVGPGPFTGLRIGIVAARTFALGRGIPVLPVVSHDALAAAAVEAGEVAPGESFLVHTDARRREWAWTRYTVPESGEPLALVADAPPALCPADALPHPELRATTLERVPAAWLARLAAARVTRGEETGPDEALYLRPADVTLSTPKKVTG